MGQMVEACLETRIPLIGRKVALRRYHGALLRTMEEDTPTASVQSRRTTWISQRSAFNRCHSNLSETRNSSSTLSPLPLARRSRQCKPRLAPCPQDHSGDVSQSRHASALEEVRILLKPIVPLKVGAPGRPSSLLHFQALQPSTHHPGTSSIWWKFQTCSAITSSRTVTIASKHHKCGSSVVMFASLMAHHHQWTNVTTRLVQRAAVTLALATAVEVIARSTRMTPAKVVGRSPLERHHAT